MEAPRGALRVAVVGGGIAGVSCVEELYSLHRLGYAKERGLHVLLVASAPQVTQARAVQQVTPLLSELRVTSSDARQELGARFPDLELVTAQIARVDALAHCIHCTDGRQIDYDRLCICTGARPLRLGRPHPRILVIRDTHSVEDLKTKLEGCRRVVIVGNGGVALELVEALDGMEVVWVVKHDHVGNTFLDDAAASFVLPRGSRIRSSAAAIDKNASRTQSSVIPGAPSSCEIRGDVLETSILTHGHAQNPTSADSAVGPDWTRGISASSHADAASLSIELTSEVEAIWDSTNQVMVWCSKHNDPMPQASPAPSETSATWPLNVRLTCGKHYDCDLVVCAIGVKPNTEFLQDTLAMAVNGGILVNTNMQAIAHTDIFAAGDCCSVEETETSACWFQMRLWSQAYAMGRRAAQAMLAATAEAGLEFELFEHATHFFGFKVVLFGRFNAQGLPIDDRLRVLVRNVPGVEYVKAVVFDGRVQGAMLIGETGLEGTFENLILNQLDVTALGDDLLVADLDLEDYFD